MPQESNHPRDGISEACSELHAFGQYPSTQSFPTWSVEEYTAIVMTASTDITLNGENIISVDNGTLSFSLDTMFPSQQFDSFVRATQRPMIVGLDHVDPIVSDNAQTMCADRTAVDANGFLPSGIDPSDDRHASTHGAPRDKELMCPADGDKGRLDSSALYPPPEASRPLETNYGCLRVPKNPQVSIRPIKKRAIVPIPSSNTSSEKTIKGRTGRYSCSVCGDRFAQLQGARRHHREKHEPRECPHCHAFRWGRPYLFKKHLKLKHPEIDSEIATSDATVRNPRKDTIVTADPMLSPPSQSQFSPPSDILGEAQHSW
ncbi:hypothetical protein EI94DRAFT_721781 [Lactarius quietus]|nr:hypothetical protein EI94DRAFT_721781 [Lactarius quietus]